MAATDMFAEGVFGTEIRLFRGSSRPFPMRLRDPSSTPPNSAIDISSATLMEMTVNQDKNPTTTANEQFKVTGTFATDGTDGRVIFQPSEVNTDIAPGLYYYDVVIDAPTFNYRPFKGIFRILQGIAQ